MVTVCPKQLVAFADKRLELLSVCEKRALYAVRNGHGSLDDLDTMTEFYEFYKERQHVIIRGKDVHTPGNSSQS